MYRVVLMLLVLTLIGCGQVHEYYQQGFEVATQWEKPSESEFRGALGDLDEAIRQAERKLDQQTLAEQDQMAYIIPLAHLAKARLYGRFLQVTAQEQECRQAIERSEQVLGKHIRALQEGRTDIFRGYSVFFRREKIRRHAYSLLKETYQQAGEKDLDELMDLQIAFSQAYLQSSFAHEEEEYIRTIENAEWFRRYESDKEDIHFALLFFVRTVGHAAEVAAVSLNTQQRIEEINKQINELRNMLTQTQDYAQRQRLIRQIDQLQREKARIQREANRKIAAANQRYQEDIERLKREYQEKLRRIQAHFRRTTFQALVANFRNLKLSPELKNLPAYRRLAQQMQDLDNYVRRGNNLKAVEAFISGRTLADQLILEKQAERRRKRQ